MQGRGEMAMDNSPYFLELVKWTIHLLQNRTFLFALDIDYLRLSSFHILPFYVIYITHEW